MVSDLQTPAAKTPPPLKGEAGWGLRATTSDELPKCSVRYRHDHPDRK